MKKFLMGVFGIGLMFSIVGVKAETIDDIGDSTSSDVTVGNVETPVYEVEIYWDDFQFDWKYNKEQQKYNWDLNDCAPLDDEVKENFYNHYHYYSPSEGATIYTDSECSMGSSLFEQGISYEEAVENLDNYYWTNGYDVIGDNYDGTYTFRIYDKSTSGRITPSIEWNSTDNYDWTYGEFYDYDWSEGSGSAPLITELEEGLIPDLARYKFEDYFYYAIHFKLKVDETKEIKAPKTGDTIGSITITITTPPAEIKTSKAAETLSLLGLRPTSTTPLTSFTGPSSEDGKNGIYLAEDDLGDSYYFRGNVTNNYVKFGKYIEDAWLKIDKTGSTPVYSYDSTCTTAENIECQQIAEANDEMYWRIVRINGDGTIRLIYDGTNAYANNFGEKDSYIGNVPFNSNSADNAYVGYMYGTPGSDNYKDTHANINDSDIKKVIDAWYAKYINANYSNYVVDAIYCNDRSLSDGSGSGTNFTGYAPYTRLHTITDGVITPTLKCQQMNDRFTKNDMVGTVNGNSKLKYSVGLMTADEMIFAGGGTSKYDLDYEMYLNSTTFLLASPNDFSVPLRSAFMSVAMNGGIYSVGLGVTNDARPSLSISSDAITDGTGTDTDPFKVSS